MDENVNCSGILTRKEEVLLIIIRGSIAAVGICACIISISLVFCLKLHKHFVYRMAMYKVVSTILVDFLHIVSTSNYILRGYHYFHHVVCQITGFLLSYFLWINLLFTIIIIFHFFSLAVCLKNMKHLEVYYIVVTLVFPLVIAWIPFTTKSYGPTYDGGLCWINTLNTDCTTNKVGKIERYVLWYGPSYSILVISIFAAVLIIIVLLYKGCCHSKENEREPLLIQQNSQHKKAVMELFPLLIYPAIFMLYIVLDTFFNRSRYKTELTYVIIISSWGMLSSITLLILIAITKYNKMKRQRQLSKSLIQYNHKTVNEDATFTAANSTGYDTVFTPQRESEIDRLFEEYM